LRRRLGNFALLLATLIVIEVALRQVMGRMEQAYLYQYSGSTGDTPCVVLRPGAEVKYTGWFLKIPAVRQEVNSLGYRGPDRPQEKSPGVFRIVALGDSYTYGMGVETGDSIPARLESELKGHGTREIEVLNFGLPGASLEDSITRLRLIASQWRPDVVLFLLYADDLNESLCNWYRPSRLAVGVLTWVLDSVRTGVIFYRFARDWALATEDEHWVEPLRQELDTLAETTREAGARLAVVALGDPSAYRRSARLEEVMTATKVPWLDAREWLFGDRSVQLPIIFGELHLTPAGNRIAAARIGSWLAASGLVPP
jgi:hypothetical protein